MKIKPFLDILVLLQSWLGFRVVKRLLFTPGGLRLQKASMLSVDKTASLSILVPVLNEYARLTPCLEGLIAQGREVREILVVDGGSDDGTQELVRRLMLRDSRIRLLDASPIPDNWNGKAWGLSVGLQHVTPDACWVLTIDADVRPEPLLVRSLLAHAQKTGLAAFSVATQQEIGDSRQGLLHPALLTTLVYRFGIPGRAISRISEVQANGQCFLVQRSILEACGGFAAASHSLCEDVTLARTLVAHGHVVGFYETDDLVRVRMYENWREMWKNWTRSLPMRDHFSHKTILISWLEILLVQALPLPLFLWLVFSRRHPWLLLLNGLGVAIRLGVLFGTARAYCVRPWSYWLSPLCDLPVAYKLGISIWQRHHTWRGRALVQGGAK